MNRQGALFICFGLMGSLIALTGLRQFFIAPLPEDVFSPVINTLWFFLQVLPLLVFLPGLLRLQLRSTFLLCLASLLYFIHGVLDLFDPQLIWMGALEIVLALGLCGLTAYMVRHMREEAAQ